MDGRHIYVFIVFEGSTAVLDVLVAGNLCSSSFHRHELSNVMPLTTTWANGFLLVKTSQVMPILCMG